MSKMSDPKGEGGFTLIEVLIASLILFLFLALAAQAFSQSAMASVKAERAAKVAAVVPLLVENIRHEIVAARSANEQAGEGVLFDMNYQWQAKLLDRTRPPRRFDPGEQEFKVYEERYNLWQVDVTVGNLAGNYRRTWRYEEISWHK